jgi:trimeric autotransporter adhesin
MGTISFVVASALACVTFPSEPVHAQPGECEPNWVATFGPLPGANLGIHAMAVFDDGKGAALYAGGDFTIVGGVHANRIAKWNGSDFEPLEKGVNETISSMIVFDDGSGPALYAGGLFTQAGGNPASHIAKWNGTTWSQVGGGVTGGPSDVYIESMIVFDDGNGPALYVGGIFGAAGGIPCANIARWDGNAWSPVESGFPNQAVRSLAVYNDGSGDALYAGGSQNFLKRWNGVSWLTVGGGVNSHVFALEVFDDGTGQGPALYAGGAFTIAGGVQANRIAKWNGNSWSAVGDGFSPTGNGWVYELQVFNDGTGSALYAGGGFITSGKTVVNGIAKWDGAGWTPLGTGANIGVNTLCGFDDGKGFGSVLYAGGAFTEIGNVAVNRIAKWDGASWNALENGLNNEVNALAISPASGAEFGNVLYVGGRFDGAGKVSMKNIGRWDGTKWSALGSGVNQNVFALLTVNENGKEVVYAGGGFNAAGEVTANHIARWDGKSWSALGNGVDSTVFALAHYDDQSGNGSELYAGVYSATAVAKWDGENWSQLASGFNGYVNTLKVYDDGLGDGPCLYAAGRFNSSGSQIVNNIARWDGSEWYPVGGGLTYPPNAEARALAVFDDGNGNALYAAGSFYFAGGNPAMGIAKWDGRKWSALSAGTSQIYALSPFHDGSKNQLCVAGFFSQIGGMPMSSIALWDGSSWSALGSGLNGVFAITAADARTPQSVPVLYAGGLFPISPAGDSFIAAWHGCPDVSTIVGDITGDGVVNVNDLMAAIDSWGACGMPCPADVAPPGPPMGDGVVNVLDLLMVINNWEE